MKILKMITVSTALVLSANTNAALISTDWNAAGDSLITYDDVSELSWLDLTETANISRDYVMTQFGTGGDFQGMRYATSGEVVALWSNFGIDLSAGNGGSTPGFNSGVQTATSYLGNVNCDYNCTNMPYGVEGVTSDIFNADRHEYLGAYWIDSYGTTYIDADNYSGWMDSSSAGYIGHYLVEASVVPVPAAVWLFGSGLIGLAGFTRRK